VCREHAALAAEAPASATGRRRLVVIPEAVEGKDTSSGATEWDQQEEEEGSP